MSIPGIDVSAPKQTKGQTDVSAPVKGVKLVRRMNRWWIGVGSLGLGCWVFWGLVSSFAQTPEKREKPVKQTSKSPAQKAQVSDKKGPSTQPTSARAASTQAVSKPSRRSVQALSETEIRWRIDQWEIRERALVVAYAHEDWKKYTRDPKFSTKKTFEALTKVRSEKAIFQVLRAARQNKAIQDPVLRRRVRMLWEKLREFHLSEKANKLRKEIHALQDKLNGIQASHRAVYKGKKTSNRDLMQIVRRSADRKAREAAWRAYATVGPKVLQGGFMNMIRLRNKYAKLLGFPTFFHYRYHKLRLHPERMWLLYEKLRQASKEANHKVRTKYKALLGVKQLMPWDRRYARYVETKKVVDLDTYFRADRLLPVMYRAYKEMGFSLPSMKIEMDLYPRPKKNQHAYCFDIDPPYDVRILANVGRPGQRAYETMLHEMGHAVHAKWVRQSIRTFRGLPDEGFLNEGSANFFGNLVNSRAFFQRYLNIPKETLAKIVKLQQQRLE